MRRTTISNLRQFLLALLFPAVAIATGLQSCNDEGPGIPAEENGPAKSSGNPLMRSPEEAIDIAQRAYEDFYGDATPSSRGRSVIDCSRPVEVVRGARSRGGSSDTLLYIVNFVDDQGFAVIAAPRAADELLAVTSQGHYYPESDPEAGSVPGFDLWMEAAGDYAASIQFPSLGDSIKLPKDTFVIVKGDTLPLPINPGGGTSIIFDSTKIVNPDEPGLLQHKEWEDTTIKRIVSPQVRNSWGQGLLGDHDLVYAPEGYLFGNGLCGCGPLAIAQACIFYREPSSVTLKDGNRHILNWDIIENHRKCDIGYEDVSWVKNNNELRACNCPLENKTAAHNMIAWLCKAIGEKAGADEKEDATSTKAGKILESVRLILPNRNISSNWTKFNVADQLLGKGQIMLVSADIKEKDSGHIWICDGSRWLEYDHYYATRASSTQPWTIQTKTHVVQKYNHFNWGWYGERNGWFNQSVVILSGLGPDRNQTRTYSNFKYIIIN